MPVKNPNKPRKMGVLSGIPWLLLAATSVSPQERGPELPAITPPGFSGLLGHYRITSSASPAEIQVEDPITLRVRITGAGPTEYAPERSKLQIFPDDMAAFFYVEDLPAQDKVMPQKGLWEFVYRLRPKSADVKRIPALTLLFFAPEARRFQSAYADEIAITVKPRGEIAAERLDLKIVRAPARFQMMRPPEEVLRDDSPVPSPGLGTLAALVGAPPLLCLVWYRLWRWYFPGAAARRRRRHSRAARRALAYLRRQSGDLPNARSGALDYLRERVDFAPLEATPSEVVRHLSRLGIAKPTIARWAAFLRTCDRSRFAPVSNLPASRGEGSTMASQRNGALATLTPQTEAIDLIRALESDPCIF